MNNLLMIYVVYLNNYYVYYFVNLIFYFVLNCYCLSIYRFLLFNRFIIIID